jgi:hypothetical protein
LDEIANKRVGRGVTRYEIVVRGELSARVAQGWEGMDLMKVEDGQTTLLAGEVVEQSQLLRGLLDRLSDFELELLSFKAVSERKEG